MSPVLQLSQVHYQVPVQDSILSILKGCDLTVQSGERIAIVGRSGSGKSTLLALMAGLDVATSGEVQLLGQPLSRLTEDERAALRATQVGFVFQNFQLLPGMTALENVMMPMELFGLANAKQRAMEALDSVELAHRVHHFPNSLSGGEQQRVAIARALVTQPAIIFADEPTGNLDETTAHHIQQLLLNLPNSTSLITVTHDMQFARQSQRHYLLTDGRLELSA
ncbi:MAG: ABC transporter ATP-binding protein [Gammaproteobacteria bacterium]|nr:ABC transporter ATP-binding protein [Gammaproteobacteria bacterium]